MYLKTRVYHVHMISGGVEAVSQAWHFEVQALQSTGAVAAACKALSIPECLRASESRKHSLHLQFVCFFNPIVFFCFCIYSILISP